MPTRGYLCVVERGRMNCDEMEKMRMREAYLVRVVMRTVVTPPSLRSLHLLCVVFKVVRN